MKTFDKTTLDETKTYDPYEFKNSKPVTRMVWIKKIILMKQKDCLIIPELT